MKINEIGEEEIINRIIKPFIDRHYLNTLDDAVAWKIGDLYIVVNVDTLVGSTDILPNTPPEYVGWKATIMTLSDVIAKGAKPIFFLNSLTLKPDLDSDYVSRLISGIRGACNFYEISLLGGDLNESNELTITGVGIGVSNRVVSRSGINEGDTVWITGEFGYTGVAFHYLLKDGKYIKGVKKALALAMKPIIKLRSGEVLSEIATASMDSSDGLAYTLNTLAEVNGVKINITEITIPNLVLEYAEENNINPLDLVFFSGEEFEIVFTSSLEEEEVLDLFKRKTGFTPIKIGYVEKGEGVYYEGKRVEKRGWQHFRGNKKKKNSVN